MRDEEHQQDARKRAGQGHQDDERIEPGLEIDHHHEIYQHNGEHHSSAQADERCPHGFDLAAGFEEAAFGQLGTEIVQHAMHLTGHAAEVAILHVGIDIVEGLHIVVIDYRCRGAALQARHVGEQLVLGASAARMYGRG